MSKETACKFFTPIALFTTLFLCFGALLLFLIYPTDCDGAEKLAKKNNCLKAENEETSPCGWNPICSDKKTQDEINHLISSFDIKTTMLLLLIPTLIGLFLGCATGTVLTMQQSLSNGYQEIGAENNKISLKNLKLLFKKFMGKNSKSIPLDVINTENTGKKLSYGNIE